jgi:hypothetical protein
MSINPTDLAAWRKSRGRVGVQELPEALPDAPFVLKVDFGGLSELAGRVPNSVLEAALREFNAVQAETEAVDQLPDGERGALHMALDNRLIDALNRYHDIWLSVFIVEPPYIPLADLPRGGCPEQAICLYDLPSALRPALVELAREGYSALESFRTNARRLVADSDGGSVAPAAEPVAAAPAPAPAVSPRSSALREVASAGTGAAGRTERGARPAPARHAG